MYTYVYMCVCMYVCMLCVHDAYLCVYLFSMFIVHGTRHQRQHFVVSCICYIYRYIYVCICVYVYICICMYICCVYLCVYLYGMFIVHSARTFCNVIYMLYIHRYTYVYMYMCMYKCVSMFICVYDVYVYV